VRRSRLHLSLAYLFGFADQSSFFGPCRRLFKVSPPQYRNQLLHGAAATSWRRCSGIIDTAATGTVSSLQRRTSIPQEQA
jgi:hypothetical protein